MIWLESCRIVVVFYYAVGELSLRRCNFAHCLVTFLSDDRYIRYNEREDVKDFDRVNEKMDSGTTR